MYRILLLLNFFLVASTTLSIAQSEPDLNKSNTLAVLGTNYVSNTGTTGVTGDLGMSPLGVFSDNGELMVKGTKIIGVPLATEALQDAKAVSDYWRTTSATPFSGANLKLNGGFPGVYRCSGDVSLDGIIVLDGNGDINSKFIFIIDGDLTTAAPTPPAPGTGLLLQNGAQPKNVFWIVKGNVNLGNSTSFQGTIISEGNISLKPGVNLIGRAVSLNGGVSLNNNNIFLPYVVIADLNVTKVAERENYRIGDEVTYTITVRNTSDGTATHLVVSEEIPSSLEFVRAESIVGTYDESRKEWVINELKSNESAELKITFRVLAAGEIVNKVTVSCNNPDPNPSNNNSEDPITVPAVSADLSVIKTANTAPYSVGGTVTYTIITTNHGPYTAENVVVNDLLPGALEMVSFTASQGVFDPATGIYTVGSLIESETATLTVLAKINEPGSIANTASAVTTTPDPDLSNNTDTETINATCLVPTLVITGAAEQCAGTSNITYTVTEVLGATYSFELTGGLTEVSRTGNSVTINVGESSGKVTAKVTDLCGTTYTVEKDVVVTATPPAPGIAGSANVCANSQGITYTAEGLGDGITYEWNATGDVQIISGQDAKTVTVDIGSDGGTLSVKGSNQCFTSATTEINISIKATPAAPGNISGPSEVCGNTSGLIYQVDPVNGATGYTWNIPSDWVIEDGQGTNTLKVKAGTSSGDITVTADGECSSSPAVVYAVNVKNVPQAPLTINGSNGACPGATLIYSVAGANGATGYAWTVPGDWIIKSGQGSNTIEVVVGSSAGQVTVAGTNECGTGATTKLDVAPTQAPAAPGVSGPDATCVNAQGLVYSIAALRSDDTYTWTVPEGWTIMSGQGTSNITVNAGTAGGQVSVTATNSCGTSTASALEVRVTPPPTAPVAIRDISTLCDGLTYTIDAVPGATDYTWTVPTGCTIVSGQGTTTISVKMDSSGSFGDVSVTANNGTCVSSVASLPINTNLIKGDLTLPKAFSPNGDGKNDVWEISNLLKYTKNHVVIFNRWGSEVYRKENYQNDWNGNKLEPGTYFYRVSVTMCDGADKVFTGYVTIFR